MVMTTLVSVEE